MAGIALISLVSACLVGSLVAFRPSAVDLDDAARKVDSSFAERASRAALNASAQEGEGNAVLLRMRGETMEDVPETSHFAHVYEDWPFRDPSGSECDGTGQALVVASRTSGLFFYKVLAGGPKLCGSWRPSRGTLTGTWSETWDRGGRAPGGADPGSAASGVDRAWGSGATERGVNYLVGYSGWKKGGHFYDYFAKKHLKVAMEGHTRYGNIFAVVTVCRGSGAVHPLKDESWTDPGCFYVKQEEEGQYLFKPVLFVFDLSVQQDWTRPRPQYAVPLFNIEAALHISLVGIGNNLHAVVSSGFSQGMLGMAGLTSAYLVAPRIATGDNSMQQIGRQRSSSLGSPVTDPTVWSFNAELTAAGQAASSVKMSSVTFPEGVTTWQTRSGKVYSITSGVMGGVGVADFSSLGEGPGSVHEVNIGHTAAYSQLVGRTWMGKGQKLYGALADWSSNGGLVVADLTSEDGVPRFVGESDSSATFKANRIVLVDLEGHHGGGQTVKFAVVPLEQPQGRFAIYDISNPAKPIRVAISEGDDKIDETYCLEVLQVENDFPEYLGGVAMLWRVILMDVNKGWFEYDFMYVDGRVLSVPVYQVHIQKGAKTPLGVQLDSSEGGFIVFAIEKGGPLDAWNNEWPSRQVSVGDHLCEYGGTKVPKDDVLSKPVVSRILAYLSESDVVHLTFCRSSALSVSPPVEHPGPLPQRAQEPLIAEGDAEGFADFARQAEELAAAMDGPSKISVAYLRELWGASEGGDPSERVTRAINLLLAHLERGMVPGAEPFEHLGGGAEQGPPPSPLQRMDNGLGPRTTWS